MRYIYIVDQDSVKENSINEREKEFSVNKREIYISSKNIFATEKF